MLKFLIKSLSLVGRDHRLADGVFTDTYALATAVLLMTAGVRNIIVIKHGTS